MLELDKQKEGINKHKKKGGQNLKYRAKHSIEQRENPRDKISNYFGKVKKNEVSNKGANGGQLQGLAKTTIAGNPKEGLIKSGGHSGNYTTLFPREGGKKDTGRTSGTSTSVDPKQFVDKEPQ